MAVTQIDVRELHVVQGYSHYRCTSPRAQFELPSHSIKVLVNVHTTFEKESQCIRHLIQ